jgi:hypothetical protein
MLGRASRVASKVAAMRAPSARIMSTAPAAEAPAMTKVYGGLSDQDRIFTNLYVRYKTPIR